MLFQSGSICVFDTEASDIGELCSKSLLRRLVSLVTVAVTVT
jgi:hypothetical protein